MNTPLPLEKLIEQLAAAADSLDLTMLPGVEATLENGSLTRAYHIGVRRGLVIAENMAREALVKEQQ